MIFSTPVAMPAGLPRFSQADKLLMFGSCFAVHIGTRLLAAKFRCDVNPYGILYNPSSVAAALDELLEGRLYTEADLYAHGGLWHSPMHHGDFSAAEPEEALRRINGRLRAARAQMEHPDGLLLTWGTAWVYRSCRTGRVVANCHKLPEREFTRSLLSVEEIVEAYARLIPRLLERNAGMKLLLTVSPVRHLRDGLPANQLSKATLLLAVHRLQELFPETVGYFPAYEIVQDELRDYRFYAADMVHPSDVAVEYVWERFAHSCLTPEAVEIMAACEKIRKALAHKPFHPGSEEHKRFLDRTASAIRELTARYPFLDFDEELLRCCL